MSSKKIQQFINSRMRVQLQDHRLLIGTLMGYDKHMNLVLSECEELRTVKNKEHKRILGFVLLRGEQVVSFSAQ